MKIKAKAFKSIGKLAKKKLTVAKKLVKLTGPGAPARLLKKSPAGKVARKFLPKLRGAIKKPGVFKNEKVVSAVTDLIRGAKSAGDLKQVARELFDRNQRITLSPIETSGRQFFQLIAQQQAKIS
ncbi:MAG: hypothetical protein JNM17_34535 [Archangium sp.]|nr:hypothetical protein [Archangium sp.]